MNESIHNKHYICLYVCIENAYYQYIESIRFFTQDAEKAQIVWPVSKKSSQPALLLPLLTKLELCNKLVLDFIFIEFFAKELVFIQGKKSENATCKGI